VFAGAPNARPRRLFGDGDWVVDFDADLVMAAIQGNAGLVVGGGDDLPQLGPGDGAADGEVDVREWTELPFDRTGDVIVPEALVLVHTATRNTIMLSTSSPTSG
jgi:hypothetical protein